MSRMKSPSAMNSGTQAVSSGSSAAISSVQPITFYHWLVVILAASGWLFDCMGQRIFVLVREPALRELLGAAASDDKVRQLGTAATTLLMLGWATGGILFGVISDRYGRVTAMVATLLSYTVFSGLSGFAHNPSEFLLYRLLFGLGVGGMFGSATTLVAESVPARVRTLALGTMQAVSALGNMLASAMSLKIIPGQENFLGHFSGWQVLGFVSVAPALLAVPMVTLLREPESWKKAKADAAAGLSGKSVGSMSDMFGEPRWRKNLLVGVCLGLAGMVGLWGIAFFSPELITAAFKGHALERAEVVKPDELCLALQKANNPVMERVRSKLAPEAVRQLETAVKAGSIPAGTLDLLVSELNRLIQGETLYDDRTFESVNLKKATRNLIRVVQKTGNKQNIAFLNRQLLEQIFPGTIRELQSTIDHTRSRGTMFQDAGALLGMFSFTLAAAYFNRRTAFLGAFVLCLATVSYTFYSLRNATDVDWMLPLMGFATLSVFAGYSIYFPELFPTRLRGTGVGLCYNTVRYLAAPFPFLLGWLSSLPFLSFRTVAIMMSGIYLLGIVALLWAPETKGKPLPEG
jgi:MFS family permease